MALNRFAITLLPKVRKAEAVNSEVLINRDTGEILAKSDAGILTSYNKQSRLDSHIKEFTGIGYAHDISGSIYNIELPGFDFSDIIPENVSVLAAPLEVLESPMSHFMISLDVDMLAVDIDGYTKLNLHQPLVDFDITFFHNITHSTYYGVTGTLPLSQLNKTPFIVTYPEHVGDTVDYKIVINNLTVKRNTLDDPGDQFVFIMHSILTNIKTEVA